MAIGIRSSAMKKKTATKKTSGKKKMPSSAGKKSHGSKLSKVAMKKKPTSTPKKASTKKSSSAGKKSTTANKKTVAAPEPTVVNNEPTVQVSSGNDSTNNSGEKKKRKTPRFTRYTLGRRNVLKWQKETGSCYPRASYIRLLREMARRCWEKSGLPPQEFRFTGKAVDLMMHGTESFQTMRLLAAQQCASKPNKPNCTVDQQHLLCSEILKQGYSTFSTRSKPIAAACK